MNYAERIEQEVKKLETQNAKNFSELEMANIFDEKLKLIRDELSRKETQVAKYLFMGATNKEISERMGITEKTVKFHLTRMYKKMNVDSRTRFQALMVFQAVRGI